MSLRDFTDKANDVLFRFNNFSTREQSISNDIPLDEPTFRRIQKYLGEPKVPSVDENTTLTSTIEMKMSDSGKACQENLQMFSDFKKLLEDSLSGNSKTANKAIYQLLCFVCVSEGTHYGNRLFYRILDDCTKISSQYTNVSSGSRAEGIEVPGGDYDIMTILETIVVDSDGSPIDQACPTLYYDSSKSYPGFVHLKIPPGPFSEELISHWGESTENGPVVSNKKFNEYFMSRYRDENILLHGPCISSTDETVDHLFCLRSKRWPKLVEPWVTRVANTDWPNDNTIISVLHEGVLFAPIGSKFGAKNDCPIEWRMSFSLSERELVQSWNHTQILCYTLFKYIRKDILKHMPYGDVFCSYFIKTTLFWVSEENSTYFWHPENIGECLQALQKRLIYWLRCGFCPHYFIPENNLFESMNSFVRNALADIISNLCQLVLQSSHYGKSFMTFHFQDLEKYTSSSLVFHEKMIAIFRCSTMILSTLKSCTLAQTNAIMIKALYRCRQLRHSYFEAGLYMLTFCYANQVLCEQIGSHTETNKDAYIYWKRVTARLLIGKNSDAMSGWSLLAMFFNFMSMYKGCQEIVDHILLKGSGAPKLLNLFVDNTNALRYFLENPAIRWTRKQSIIHHLNTTCIQLLYMTPQCQWLMSEIQQDVGFEVSRIHPVILGHFLRFAIGHKMVNAQMTDRAVRDIIKETRENEIPGFYRERLATYIILVICYKKMGDQKAAQYWMDHVHRYWDFCGTNK